MRTRNKIDLNSDVGESFGTYKLGMDEKVIPLISSANIACGFHAGDPAVMRKTMALAKKHEHRAGRPSRLSRPARVRPPQHGGLPRRNQRLHYAYQVGALQAFAAMEGLTLQHVKPHGALYNMAVRNTAIWDAVAEVLSKIDRSLILVVLAGINREDLLQRIGARHRDPHRLRVLRRQGLQSRRIFGLQERARSRHS
jgi:5-oxoprolinase (ATP-hydrolysing) subunit A